MEQKLATVQDIAGKRFDFVIVGLALANNLSKNGRVSVAVLEAGKAHVEDPVKESPDGWAQQLMNPEYDWTFPVVPQQHAGGNSIFWSRGKGLGGTSAMNCLGWTRPQREDFDAIEKLGNPEWNFDNFFEHSKKTEKFLPTEETKPWRGYEDLYNTSSLGSEGPVALSFARICSGVEYPFQKSLEKFGVQISGDTLSGNTLGTSKVISSIDPVSGKRAYSASHCLFPVLGRPNLAVLSEAYVTKVLTSKDGDELVATGVEFEHGGEIFQVSAAKEVILSAGAIKSPNILEHSGIGDRNVLEPLGIPVQLDLPAVGNNVQEHVTYIGLVFRMKNGYDIATGDLMRDPAFRDNLKKAYPDVDGQHSLVWSGTTMMSLHTVTDKADAFIEKQRRKIERESNTYPPGLMEQYEMQLKLYEDRKVPNVEIMLFPFSLAPDTSGKPHIMLLPAVNHPFSRGAVHISSADPKANPAIDPHYFEEDIDMQIMVETMKFARKVADTEPFKSFVVTEVSPGPDVADDMAIREHIKKDFMTVWHTTGTLSMLPRDKGGVVDPKLKVYETKNIRVADLSVIPLQVSAHTQAIAYGIAEMAADIIQREHKL
ncbi:GMC oxidoreductase [Wolfiporia cocos MD-104 SS10]|uniref:GMC oxidoreductase n=1 Tax=Wolfiporia cocos (strain MD-104) TaxID=742152 RepID=A0A2H3IYF4_WOLCO|nr:GMC oxidoreductase [Wolfiporia cocos MD-104 SS10]